MKRSIDLSLRVGFGLGLALLLGIAAASWHSSVQSRAAFSEVDRTQQVLQSLNEALIALNEAESAVRGYVITGDDRFLAPFLPSQKSIETELANARTLIGDTPVPKVLLEQLESLAAEKMAVLEARITLYKEQGAAAAAAEIGRGAGFEIMVQIREAYRLLTETEQDLLHQRSVSAQRWDRIALVMSVAGGLLAAAAVGLAAWQTFRHLRQRQQAEDALQEANNRLESRVTERTAELTRANDTLRAEFEERKRAENSLRESEERFRTLVESVKDYAILMLDPEGRIVSWNAGAERIKGYEPHEVIGRHFSLFYPHEGIRAGKPELELKEAAAKGRFEDEGWRLRKDGTPFWANVVVTALKDSQGRLLGFSKISRDLTERRRAEEEIQKLNEELEQRVIARTAELEAVNKELEAFSYSVSHDLRAPLRHVDGFVSMLRQATTGTLNDKAKRYLDIIADSARQMGRLVDDLLAFSRMGRVEMRASQLNLDPIVAEARRAVEMDAGGRKITWKVAPMPEVEADPSMIRLVWTNLLSNAVKYTRHREHTEIEVGTRAGNNGDIVFFVRDNGVGFDMQYVDKLFGVFQRLHRADEFEGTGIGLANVRRIITRHGGRTWAEGILNVGATVYFTLPGHTNAATNTKETQ